MNDNVAAAFVTFIMFGSIAGYYALKLLLKHKEKELEYRAQGKLGSTNSAETIALQEEIAKLRQMTTQYALSVENSMQEMKHRVEFLEMSLRQARNPGEFTTPAATKLSTTDHPSLAAPQTPQEQDHVAQVGLGR